MLKLLSLKHLNNLALNIINLLDYFRNDNKRVFNTVALSLGVAANGDRRKERQSVRGEKRGKRIEIIRVDLTQGFLLLPSSLIFISSFIKRGVRGCVLAVRAFFLHLRLFSISLSFFLPIVILLSPLNTLFSCLS